MKTQSYLHAGANAMPDPRDPPYWGPQPAPPCTLERARAAEHSMHCERSKVVDDVGQTDPKGALRILLDLYADGRYVLLAYDQLCDANGPETMSRLLSELARESQGGRLMPTTRRDVILLTLQDLVMKFLWDDRKEDEELTRADIENAIDLKEITVDEIVNHFRDQISEQLR